MNSLGKYLGVTILWPALFSCGTDQVPPTQSAPQRESVFSKEDRWYLNLFWHYNQERGGSQAISQFNTGVWLNSVGDIEVIPAGAIPNIPIIQDGVGPNDGFGLKEHLEEAQNQNNALIQLVLHNLPGRDCWAETSLDELPVSNLGMNAYREHYIDRIEKIIRQYPQVPIVVILEPNSALHLSNLYQPANCESMGNHSVNGYVNGIRYAINTLSPLENVHIYLDAGGANKFGWDEDLQYAALFMHGIITGFSGLDSIALNLFDEISISISNSRSDPSAPFIEPPPHPGGNTHPPGYDSISGFISNVVDYVPLTEPYLGDPREPFGAYPLRSAQFYDWNPRFDALDYAENWLDALKEYAGTTDSASLGMVIDTSRNGWGGKRKKLETDPTTLNPIEDVTLIDEFRIDQRPHRLSWCNQAGAGLGRRPQANPEALPWLDAFLWTKPPGNSDGNSQLMVDGNFHTLPYIDMCAPEGINLEAERWEVTQGLNIPTGALPNAPQYGAWHQESMDSLIENAWPPICEGRGDNCPEQ